MCRVYTTTDGEEFGVELMKVGELAKRTGLTVRTLHHYDEVGLLRPGERTLSGHRLYGEPEVRRLQQIASLKHLGVPLAEIRACLERPEYSLAHVLQMQAERIEEQIGRLNTPVLHLQFSTFYRGDRLQEAIADHRTIIDAIEAGDAAEAEMAMRRHVENGFKFLLNLERTTHRD